MRRFLKFGLPRWTFGTIVTLIYGFMILPIIVVVVASLNAEPYLDLPPSSLSLRWYAEVLTSEWLPPLRLSLLIAFAVAFAAALLGGLGAFAIARYRFPGRNAMQAFLLSPLAVPSIVTGVAVLQFLSVTGLRSLIGLPALVLAHVAVTIPFAVRMILISLFNFNLRLEQAAASLGARPWQTFWHITLPLLKPGIFAGMTFAFVISFNNVPVSLFLVRPGTTTLPIKILNYLEYRLDPTLAAVNMVSLFVVLAIVLVAERIGGFTRFVYGRD
jgi:putative spermidine/putrescine transport system permease protein